MGVRQSSIGWILGRVWLFDEGGMEGEREGGREGGRERDRGRDWEFRGRENRKFGRKGRWCNKRVDGWNRSIRVSLYSLFSHPLPVFIYLYGKLVNFL